MDKAYTALTRLWAKTDINGAAAEGAGGMKEQGGKSLIISVSTLNRCKSDPGVHQRLTRLWECSTCRNTISLHEKQDKIHRQKTE